MDERGKPRSDAEGERPANGEERRQRKLDEALKETFPASDPPAVRPGRADADPVPDGTGGADGRAASPRGDDAGAD